MNTKSKYSPFERYYYIADSENKYYWQKNIRYGYNYQNQAVFEARFVNKLIDATALTWDEANVELERFKEPHISGGLYKVDTSKLIIERFPELISEEDMKLFQ